jgi:hypothetical protein
MVSASGRLNDEARVAGMLGLRAMATHTRKEQLGPPQNYSIGGVVGAPSVPP